MPHKIMVFILVFVSMTGPKAFASKLNQAANSFIQTLTNEQKSLALFPFTDKNRVEWVYVPADRDGVALKQLNTQQRQNALNFLRMNLSQQGYQKALDIMSLEQVLFLMSGQAHRDQELYYISFFGQPERDDIWSWRFEGHHLSLNFTIKGGSLSAVTPNFWGTNPAHVKSGEKKGLRVLGSEEDLARELVNSLSTQQQKIAIISKNAYKDILTKNKSQVSPLSDAGISYARLTKTQRETLQSLISLYLNNMPKHIALTRYQKIMSQPLETLKFAWAGSTRAQQKHYYRIQGDTFLIEYDNVQNNGNHVHAVWRDFDGDFGRDILKSHHHRHSH